MISYFKRNDSFRLLPLLLLAFLIKLPSFLNPTLYPEITRWFVVGEAMQSGSMYIDIWDSMAPFSAITYQGFTWAFGRNILLLLIIGTLLTVVQAAIINAFSIAAKLFYTNTYLPAFIYILLTSSHPAFFTLSPSLIGLTFILLGLGKLLKHIEFRANHDMHIVMIALYFGFSLLFHLPYIVIIPVSLILLLLFSNTIPRRYFLLLFTSATPVIFAFFYYWQISGKPTYFIANFLKIKSANLLYTNAGWFSAILVLTPPLLFMLFGVLSIGRQKRLTSYKLKVAQLFFTIGVLMLTKLFLESRISTYSLVIFIPITSYFTMYFIILFKRQVYTIILSIILLAFPIIELWAISENRIFQTEQKAKPSPLSVYKERVKNKNIMVLGFGKNLYTEARLSGPFYDWDLSKDFFKALNYYDNLVFLQNQIAKAKPDLIIDLEGNIPKISKRLPKISKNYYLIAPKVWKKKE